MDFRVVTEIDRRRLLRTAIASLGFSIAGLFALPDHTASSDDGDGYVLVGGWVLTKQDLSSRDTH